MSQPRAEPWETCKGEMIGFAPSGLQVFSESSTQGFALGWHMTPFQGFLRYYASARVFYELAER